MAVLVAMLVVAGSCSRGGATSVDASARPMSPAESESSTTSTTAAATSTMATTTIVASPGATATTAPPAPGHTVKTTKPGTTTALRPTTTTTTLANPSTTTTQPRLGGRQGQWSCLWHVAPDFASVDSFDCQGDTPEGQGTWRCDEAEVNDVVRPWTCTGPTGAGVGSWTWYQDRQPYPFNNWRMMVPDALRKGPPGFSGVNCFPVTEPAYSAPPTGDWRCYWYPTGATPAATVSWHHLGDPVTKPLAFEGTGDAGFGPGTWTCTRPVDISTDHTVLVACQGTVGYAWLVTPAPVVWPAANE